MDLLDFLVKNLGRMGLPASVTLIVGVCVFVVDRQFKASAERQKFDNEVTLAQMRLIQDQRSLLSSDEQKMREHLLDAIIKQSQELQRLQTVVGQYIHGGNLELPPTLGEEGIIIGEENHDQG